MEGMISGGLGVDVDGQTTAINDLSGVLSDFLHK